MSDSCASPKLETSEGNTRFGAKEFLESVVLFSANQILRLGSPE
jgi:hypothetical protein